jgi:hypothetical protein
VALSTIPYFCLFILSFTIPPFLSSSLQLFVYFLVLLLLLSSANTGQVVPYRGLIPEVALTYQSRQELFQILPQHLPNICSDRTTLSFSMEMIGGFMGIAASFITGWIVEKYDEEPQGSCKRTRSCMELLSFYV